ncbi:hypothetical protein Tcan_15078 [Toxocara canis]|uniref:Uncharacterized protein n=1 Tax=Toxocara canis TaxID=6265 RepID=A0A0B2VEA3_TOXCA|nr:hypothetical protein Tcan_15078 [Toxocara canis]
MFGLINETHPKQGQHLNALKCAHETRSLHNRNGCNAYDELSELRLNKASDFFRARELWCLLKELQECAMIKYIILVGSANVNRRASGTESSERANQFAEKTCPAGGGNAIELGVLHPTDEYQSTS